MIAVRKRIHGVRPRHASRSCSPGNRKVLAYLREYGDETHPVRGQPLARRRSRSSSTCARYKGRVPVELLGRTPFPPIGELPYLLTLPATASTGSASPPTPRCRRWHEERAAARGPAGAGAVRRLDAASSATASCRGASRMAEKARAQLEPKCCRASSRRSAGTPPRASRCGASRWSTTSSGSRRRRSWLLALVDVERRGGEPRDAISCRWRWPGRTATRSACARSRRSTVAKVRQQAEVGVLADAFADEAFCRALVAAIGAGARAASRRTARCASRRPRAFAALAGDALDALPVGCAARAEQQHHRHARRAAVPEGATGALQAGINPEVEIGRFLTEVARFPHSVPVAGSARVRRRRRRARRRSRCCRATSRTRATAGTTRSTTSSASSSSWRARDRRPSAARRHARRLPRAGAHARHAHRRAARGARARDRRPGLRSRAGARRTTSPPGPQRVRARGERDARPARAAPRAAARAARAPTRDALLAQRDALLARIDAARGRPARAARKTRMHGDYHLARCCCVQNDFVIIDFEGEPARSLRRARAPSSRRCSDVAGMLRSFDYALHAALRASAASRAGRASRARRAGARLAAARRARPSSRLRRGRARPRARCAARRGGARLLELFVLEKALYELRYELDNRPDWVRVPLRGLADILARA